MSDRANPIQIFTIDALEVRIYADARSLAQGAARATAVYLQNILHQQSSVRAVLATGNSQIQFLDRLISSENTDWSRVTFFHLDEYLGIDGEHPASFRRYLRDRVQRRISPQQFHYLQGDAVEPLTECQRYERLIREKPLDLCCLGIGENGHLAFNEPNAADFNDSQAVKIVQLDPQTRQQQVDGGFFPTLDAVPSAAITLTLPSICSAKKIVCLAPGSRKATIIQEMLQGEIHPSCPASILRTQPQATLFLDSDSASLLDLAAFDINFKNPS
ncbi:MAG: glucosamine-6-phosphate deaminase [Cyanobacteriota bacterium]|nr:glucosamine-6-phosphate deaminase [Cyanobacteriota bacterium]